LVVRAIIVRLAERGLPHAVITARLNLKDDTVRKCRGRFAADGIDGVRPGGLAVVYRYAPDRANAKVRWIGLGSVVATALWALGSAVGTSRSMPMSGPVAGMPCSSARVNGQ
jgi:hypothetical protein